MQGNTSMQKIVFDRIWRKRWFLFIFGPILGGIFGFCEVIIGVALPDWLFLMIIIISVPTSIVSVILGWIHVYHFYRNER